MGTFSISRLSILLFLINFYLSFALECFANPYRPIDAIADMTQPMIAATNRKESTTATVPLPSINNQPKPTNSEVTNVHTRTPPEREPQNDQRLPVAELPVLKSGQEGSQNILLELCGSTNDLDKYFKLGMSFEKRGMNDEAIMAYKTAIIKDPNNTAARIRLAEVRYLQGNEKGALEDYAEFLRLNPESPDIQIKMARILSKNNRSTFAIDLYKSVLKQAPNDANVHRELAIIYKNNRELENATAHFQKAIELNKNDLESRNNLIYLYSIAKKINDLRQLLEETVRLFPDDINSHYKLAVVYDYLREYSIAIEQYKRTIALKPDHIKSIAALKSVYLKTGKYQEVKDLNKTLTNLDQEQLTALESLTAVADNFDPAPNKINYSLKKRVSPTTKKAKQSSKNVNKKKKAKQKGDSK